MTSEYFTHKRLLVFVDKMKNTWGVYQFDKGELEKSWTVLNALKKVESNEPQGT